MNRIITHLVRVLLKAHLGPSKSVDGASVDLVAVALEQKIKAMPFILKNAMQVLIFLFNIGGVLLKGKFFTSQDQEQQAQYVLCWKNAPLGLCREFIAFFEKLIVFIYYSLCPHA